MSKISFVMGVLLISSLIDSAQAATMSPEDWQKNSLKGISAIRYGIVGSPGTAYITDVTNSLAALKVQTSKIENFKDEREKDLSPTEARLKIVADEREKNQAWVGLSIEQRCQIKRTPSIEVDGETYSIGTMCPRAKVKEHIKKVCEQFVSDFSASAKR